MKTWEQIIKREQEKDYFKKLTQKVLEERKQFTVYPSSEDVFKTLELTSLNDVKVVLLGQDPYHEPNQATGLAFSVPRFEKIPPSLRNIYKELHSDLGIEIPNHGDISALAKEGVLLLNTVLTVRCHKANSHHDFGWITFTDELIKELNAQSHPIVFILLGNHAKCKKELITNQIHCIIEGVHPSPLSANRGFFGSKIFSKTNDFLRKNNIPTINWNVINE